MEESDRWRREKKIERKEMKEEKQNSEGIKKNGKERMVSNERVITRKR